MPRTYRVTYTIEVEDSQRSYTDTNLRARRAAEIAQGWLRRARHVRRASLDEVKVLPPSPHGPPPEEAP